LDCRHQWGDFRTYYGGDDVNGRSPRDHGAICHFVETEGVGMAMHNGYVIGGYCHVLHPGHVKTPSTAAVLA